MARTKPVLDLIRKLDCGCELNKEWIIVRKCRDAVALARAWTRRGLTQAEKVQAYRAFDQHFVQPTVTVGR